MTDALALAAAIVMGLLGIWGLSSEITAIKRRLDSLERYLEQLR